MASPRIKLDWLTINFPVTREVTRNGTTAEALFQPARHHSLAVGGSGILRHDSTRRFELAAYLDAKNGTRVSYRKGSEAVTCTTEYSGQCLNSSSIAREIIQNWRYSYPDATISRFDTAVDVVDEGGQLHEAITREAAELIHRDNSPNVRIVSSGTGNTVYLGSRLSAAMMRIYQKRMTLDGPLLCRFELEGKPERKLTIEGNPMEKLLAYGIHKIRQMLSDYLPQSTESVLLSMPSSTSALRWYNEQQESKREQWFYSSVYPAFKKLLSEDRSAAARVVGLFMAELHNAVDAVQDFELIVKTQRDIEDGIAKQDKLL